MNSFGNPAATADIYPLPNPQPPFFPQYGVPDLSALSIYHQQYMQETSAADYAAMGYGGCGSAMDQMYLNFGYYNNQPFPSALPTQSPSVPIAAQSSPIIPTQSGRLFPADSKLRSSPEQPNSSADGGSLSNGAKGRRKRILFTPAQVRRLEQEFAAQRFPSHTQRQQVAQEINLTGQQVKIWFQNRRYKTKIAQKDRQLVQGLPATPGSHQPSLKSRVKSESDTATPPSPPSDYDFKVWRPLIGGDFQYSQMYSTYGWPPPPFGVEAPNPAMPSDSLFPPFPPQFPYPQILRPFNAEPLNNPMFDPYAPKSA